MTLAFALTPAGGARADLPGSLSDAAAAVAPKGAANSALVDGLREMLKVGTANAVQEVGREDGYLGNQDIRIKMPQTLDGTAGKLRTMKLGALVDDLETSMNRAAEKASAQAQPVFEAAIAKLSFGEAAQIMGGSERAATELFDRTTREELAKTFRPIVEKSMEDVGLAKVYDAFVKPIKAIPFMSAPQIDLTEHITQEALDGLFEMLGREEAKMRKDPASRTTPLLQGLFGS
jgi:hypothetical protein